MERALFVATYGDFFVSFLLDKIALLQKRGIGVVCAANFEEKAYNRFSEELRLQGVELRHVPFARSPYSLKTMKAYKILLRVMREEKITLVDCHNPVAAALARWAAAKLRIEKVVYTAHGFFFYRGASPKYKLLYKPVEFFLAKRTDILIVMNEEDYAVAKKMKVRKCVRLVHGVGVELSKVQSVRVSRTEMRRRLGAKKTDVLFVSVGECIVRKNHIVALKALQKSGMKNAVYLVVGEGKLLTKLKAEAKRLHMENRVIFAGYRTDVAEILRAADVFLFPSLQEGLPVALVESMAAGLPVLCSNIRGNRDCIVEGKGGFLASPTDVDRFADGIQKLCRSEELRRAFGAYNRAGAERFGRTEVMKEYEEIYAELLSGEAGEHE